MIPFVVRIVLDITTVFLAFLVIFFLKLAPVIIIVPMACVLLILPFAVKNNICSSPRLQQFGNSSNNSGKNHRSMSSMEKTQKNEKSLQYILFNDQARLWWKSAAAYASSEISSLPLNIIIPWIIASYLVFVANIISSKIHADHSKHIEQSEWIFSGILHPEESLALFLYYLFVGATTTIYLFILKNQFYSWITKLVGIILVLAQFPVYPWNNIMAQGIGIAMVRLFAGFIVVLVHRLLERSIEKSLREISKNSQFSHERTSPTISIAKNTQQNSTEPPTSSTSSIATSATSSSKPTETRIFTNTVGKINVTPAVKEEISELRNTLPKPHNTIAAYNKNGSTTTKPQQQQQQTKNVFPSTNSTAFGFSQTYHQKDPFLRNSVFPTYNGVQYFTPNSATIFQSQTPILNSSSIAPSSSFFSFNGNSAKNATNRATEKPQVLKKELENTATTITTATAITNKTATPPTEVVVNVETITTSSSTLDNTDADSEEILETTKISHSSSGEAEKLAGIFSMLTIQFIVFSMLIHLIFLLPVVCLYIYHVLKTTTEFPIEYMKSGSAWDPSLTLRKWM